MIASYTSYWPIKAKLYIEKAVLGGFKITPCTFGILCVRQRFVVLLICECEQKSFQCWTTDHVMNLRVVRLLQRTLTLHVSIEWGASVFQCSGHCELTILEGALDIVNLGMCVLGRLKFESHKQGS